MKKVFIDGQAGTTGLIIRQMLKKHKEIKIIEIEEQYRKDVDKKKELFKESDLVVLCLPDDAAKEAVKEIPQNIKVIDASSAHRIANGWVYGFAEFKNSDNRRQRDIIKNSNRITNPGCHSTGAISIIRPLITENIAGSYYPFSITSLTGYSGGGRKMIESYEKRDKNDESWAVRPYSLNLKHKHIPEIVEICGLKFPPVFYPVLGTMERGMLVSVGLENRLLSKKGITAKNIHDALEKYYDGEKFVKVLPFNDNSILANGAAANAYLTATNCNNTNKLEIIVFGNEDQTILIARLDNLGKGASGAAVQNLNITLGFDEAAGLE